MSQIPITKSRKDLVLRKTGKFIFFYFSDDAWKSIHDCKLYSLDNYEPQSVVWWHYLYKFAAEEQGGLGSSVHIWDARWDASQEAELKLYWLPAEASKA
jgi:hypothetical protein